MCVWWGRYGLLSLASVGIPHTRVILHYVSMHCVGSFQDDTQLCI